KSARLLRLHASVLRAPSRRPHHLARRLAPASAPMPGGRGSPRSLPGFAPSLAADWTILSQVRNALPLSRNRLHARRSVRTAPQAHLHLPTSRGRTPHVLHASSASSPAPQSSGTAAAQAIG